MRLSIPRKEWLEAIALIAPVAPAKPSLHALAFIRIDAQSSIEMRATDLVTFARVDVPGEVMKPGSCLVEAKTLSSIARVIPDSAMFVTVEVVANGRLRIVGGGVKHEVATISVDEFPMWPNAVDEMSSIRASEMARAIRVVEHAMSSDDTRPHMACLRVVADGTSMSLVTTDGHRFATTRIPHASPAFEASIPFRAVSAILRLLDASGDGDVLLGVSVTGAHVGIKAVTREIVLRAVEEPFPPWRAMIPAQSSNRATMLRDKALAVLRNVELAARRKIKDAGAVSQIAIRMHDGVVAFTGANTDGMSADGEIDCDYSSADQTIGINAAFLIDTLSAMSADEVVFDVRDRLEPMRVEPASDDASIFIVAAMRI